MRDIKNIILCGCGAVGSVYADIFSKCPKINFRVLVNEERLKRYKVNPIIFNGIPLQLNYILPSEVDFKADLIIIATKMSGLSDALSQMENFVAEDTVILPLLNGVMSEEIVAAKYGRNKVLYSYFIGHSAVRVGNSITQDGVNTIVFGSDCPADVENVSRVKSLFDACKVNYSIPEDIKHSLWLKFMLNVCANPTTALFRANFGQMRSNPLHMNIALKILREVQLVAKAEGIKNSDMLVDETLDHLKLIAPQGKTSMLQDVEAGRKTENDIFAKTVVALAKKHAIDTPYCSVISELFDVIDFGK